MTLLFKYAWKEVRRRKKRSISTLLGYAIAIAAIIILASFIIYANKIEEGVMYNKGTRLIAYTPSSQEDVESHEGFVAFTTYTELMGQDIYSKISISELIDDVSPYIGYKMENQINGISSITIGGFDTSNKKAVYKNYCSPDEIIKGRFINSGERDVIMVGESFANIAHLDIGDSLTIQDKNFTVIGIVHTEMELIKSDVYMNIDDAYNLISERTGQSLEGKFNCLLISVADARFQEKAIEKLESVLGSKVVLTTSSCYRPSVKAMGANASHMFLIFIIILISTVLYSIKIQHGSVVERYHDIGILKAIGWSNYDIIRMIFMESAIQSVLGGIIGCIIGTIVILIVPFGNWIDSTLDTVYALISWEAILFGLAAAIICGSLTALVSGLIISQKEPATILRRI